MAWKQETRVAAMCLFEKDGKLLVVKGNDRIKQKKFYRVLGGGVDFQELAEAGVRREIREELGSEIENLKFIDVVENIFVFEEYKGHEVVFLYSGDLARKELYEKDSIKIIEPDHKLEAVWVPVDEILSGTIPLYPAYNYQELFKP